MMSLPQSSADILRHATCVKLPDLALSQQA
jgi:phage tail protein X